MLAYNFHRPADISRETPVLVFLHGLLGSGDDWQACIAHLQHCPTLTLDLPYHGQSQHIDCADFDQLCQQIVSTLETALPPQQAIILVGYSLGGRIAMYGIAKQRFAQLNLIKAIIEGGNFGLRDETSRQARWQNDTVWAARFKREPIERVLADWYQQAVFCSLNHEQRQTLISKRSANLGPAIGRMLEIASLAKQPWLLPELCASGIDVHYICGGKDSKFSQLAKHSGLSFSQIAEAGHNVHFEHPRAFAVEVLIQFELVQTSD